MSDPTTFSQPPELTSTPSRVPPPLPAEAQGELAEAVHRLRAELSAATEPARQARLLVEMGEAQERAGDEPAATRDYLAAYTADPSFREPLEGLVRLLEKRRSLRNLGRLVDALVAAAAAPDERVRSLLMRAAYLVDVAGSPSEAQIAARSATTVDDAPRAEQASAWLTLEVLAGRTGDGVAREEALGHRVRFADDPAWRALLLVDLARNKAASGDVETALALVNEACSFDSEARWIALGTLEEIAREHAASADRKETRARAELHAAALEGLAALVSDAISDGARGDALGVPLWVRQPARMVDAWIRAAEARRVLGQLDRASATLDKTLALLEARADAKDGDDHLAVAVVCSARIRLAELLGDTELAAFLAEKRLASEGDPGLAAALALRVAEHAAAEGDTPAALDALSRAIQADPGSLPARALQLDILADAPDGAAFAAQLEAFAEHLATDDGRGRAFILAAYVWAVRATDVAGARAALSQAAMYGVPPGTIGRLARTLASVAGDATWYEEATKRLLAAGGADPEAVSLHVELVRLRFARGDAEGAARALREMGGTPRGGWLARAVEAFATTPAPTSGESPGRARAALEELAGLETDPHLRRGLGLAAAMRAHAAGDIAAARARLRELADREAADPVVTSFLADLDRAAGDHLAAARVASDAAAATPDRELAAVLRLEAAFERWRAGDRAAAAEEIEAAAADAPTAAKLALAWTAWGVEPDSLDARRQAVEDAETSDGDTRALLLERFALEVAAGDPGSAIAALAALDESPDGPLGTAAALARLAWSGGSGDGTALGDALSRVSRLGADAKRFATAEQVRVARATRDPDGLLQHTRAWYEAGGGLPAALEWISAASAAREPHDERSARLAVAASLPTGAHDAREAILASAALAAARVDPHTPVPLASGDSAVVHLANLELGPPGGDPRRRAAVLTEIDGILGEDAATDAIALSGWSFLATGAIDDARTAFARAATARPADLAAWEGLRACAVRAEDRALHVRAACELGARCNDHGRAAAFWEEAALLAIELGDDATADHALEASFDRDATRAVAFDKLFRRVRDRKDHDKLLALISRRLEVSDEPGEIQKLFWEQARVLRAGGDQEGALKALEHVTMLDPDHVGALALLGEINIRRANFEEAAGALGRLAKLDTAPPKNRLTAGIAAVDLYENKLQRFDAALEVLVALHAAKLSNLPVRERLARAAARTGSWKEATAILKELMHERADRLGRIEAARLAMAIHRDRLGNPQDAAPAIVKLLEEDPGDGEALDMLLQTNHPPELRDDLLRAARDSLVAGLALRPTEVTLVRRLVKVARTLKDDALQQVSLGVLSALGAADVKDEQAFAQLAARKGRTPQVTVSETMLRAILAPGDEGPIAELFALLGPTLSEALGPSLAASGVGRRDKVDPRSGLALRNEVAAWAGAFGIREFDLYVGGKEPLEVQGIPGEPPAIIVGPSIKAPLAPIIRARVVRELVAMVRGTVIARSRDDVTMAAIVVSACRIAEVPIENPPYAVLAEVERLIGKAIARRTRKALPEICRAIVSGRLDARGWSHRALASHDRVAAIASGDPAIVLGELLGAPPDRLAQCIPGSARAEELLRFVLSPQYVELRRSLGLEGT